MILNLHKLILSHSTKKEFFIVVFFLLISTVFQYLLYITLPILVYKITAISLNSSEEILRTSTTLEHINKYFFFDLEFILYATVVLTLIANISSILFIKKSAFFSFKMSSDIQIKIFKSYLYKEYSYYLNNSKSGSLNNIITDMFRLPAGIFIPYFQLISASILSVLLIATLFIVNFKISLLVLIVLTITYLGVFKFFKKKLYQTSVDISSSHKKIYEVVEYSLGLNKDLKIYNLENFIKKKFTSMSKVLISTRTFANFISVSPKYIVEAIVIFFSILAILAVYKNGEFNGETILFFMFFGILSIKIIPAIQSIYVCISAIQSNISLINNLPNIKSNIYIRESINEVNSFEKKYELKNINFSYDNNRKILTNLNLKIARGDKISIIGANGSGKSTLINLMTGLLKPSSGNIYCDDKKVTNKNLFQLFSILDPNPLFMNTNIYENICFKEKTTHKEKWEINQILKIVELNPKNLAKYTENIEAKFSQGEKQKIALARFLFFKRKFLIIDEGTTNLSSKLEFRLLNKIKKKYPQLTIIFITHRYVNLKFFHKVYELKNMKLFKRKNL